MVIACGTHKRGAYKGGVKHGLAAGVAGGLALISLLAAQTAVAEPLSSAQKLRRLDIMLMVTGLRCRHGPDNFQADFQAFEARHLQLLNEAAATLKGEFTRQYGVAGSAKALDRVSVQIANAYGNGHPWLDCHDLKLATQALAVETDQKAVILAAEQLLSGDAQAGANAVDLKIAILN